MKKICVWVFWLYVTMSALAVVVTLISTLGLLGVQPTPFGAIFAVMLSQPWFSIASNLGAGSFTTGLALICAGLVLNATILRLICVLLYKITDRFS